MAEACSLQRQEEMLKLQRRLSEGEEYLKASEVAWRIQLQDLGLMAESRDKLTI